MNPLLTQKIGWIMKLRYEIVGETTRSWERRSMVVVRRKEK